VSTAAVVLAAGGGERFEGTEHKLRAVLRGQPLVAHAVKHAMGGGFGEVVVVTGAVDLDDVIDDRCTRLHNPAWSEGQATSLQVAVDHARAVGHAAIVVGLGDQPFVAPEVWRSVAASESPLAVATFEGRRRPPVRLAAEVWPLLPRRGDEGARRLLASRPELVREVPCRGEPADIDTLEDLARWS